MTQPQGKCIEQHEQETVMLPSPWLSNSLLEFLTAAKMVSVWVEWIHIAAIDAATAGESGKAIDPNSASIVRAISIGSSYRNC